MLVALRSAMSIVSKMYLEGRSQSLVSMDGMNELSFSVCAVYKSHILR